ncbi:MAG: DUF3450 domain-containing protein [Muribaculaceae bacterium]|nr:DUF3450 domain-containing protein [Muribaculaceae bacterium]MDE7109807.1 DUF3450 domain-containing protein [Muribaculaceae bacterium]
MAQPLLSILADLNEKISRLAGVQEALKKRIIELERENENLKAELKESRDMLDKANTDVEFLTMSHRLAENPDSIIATRRRIARLIRTIDNCISMIKEE